MVRAAGTDDVDAALLLGALAWCIALTVSLAGVADGPIEPVLTLDGAPAPIDEPAAASAVVAISEECLARIARADRSQPSVPSL